MNLALVMFLKALLLSFWGWFTVCWVNFRKIRAQRGIPLRLNRKGVYVPNDWAAKVEKAAKLLAKCFMVLVVINAVFWLSLVAYYKLG
jgi:hypothetical protein